MDADRIYNAYIMGKEEVVLISKSLMRRGKVGLFDTIERSANLISAHMFVALELLLCGLSVLLYFKVRELNAMSTFMVLSVIMLIVSAAELVFVRKREGKGIYLKWMTGVSFVISAVFTTSTLGLGGSILFVLPILLSVQYCSLLYSIFISVITVLGSFIPLLLTSFVSFYDLNVIKLFPGSVITIDKTLEGSLRPEIIDIAGTKINEMLAIFLPAILFLIIVAIVTCVITSDFRKYLLEQYRAFQNSKE